MRLLSTSIDTTFMGWERAWRSMSIEHNGGALVLLLISSELLALVEPLISLATSTKVASDSF
jgi:hypothetical protein